MSKLLSITALTLIGILLTFNFAQAGLMPCGTSEHPEECTLCHFFILLQKYINGFLGIISGILLFISIVVGFMFLFGSASPELLTRAKKALTAAFVGFFIILIAWLIVFSVGKIAGWKEETGKWWEIHCEAE